MTKQERPLLLAVFVVSALCLIVLLIAIATSNWVVSDPVITHNDQELQSNVNYGLFQGSYSRLFPISVTQYTIKITCIFEHNICAMSCEPTAERRYKEVEALFNNEKPPFSCSSLQSLHILNATEKEDFHTVLKSDCERMFINGGVWISTLIFLAVSVLLTSISCIVALRNLVGNPIEIYCSICSLYIWNSVAAFTLLLVLLLWGIHYATNLSKNIALLDTIVGDWTSAGYTALGFSYWFIFLVILLHLANIGILYWRQYRINKIGETVKTPTLGQADGTIFLY